MAFNIHENDHTTLPLDPLHYSKIQTNEFSPIRAGSHMQKVSISRKLKQRKHGSLSAAKESVDTGSYHYPTITTR